MQRWTTGLLATALIVAVLVAGSIAYWFGEGRPGTPEQFRRRVADTGLGVDWSNNGPTGGDGVVERDCGPTEVSVRELDGELFVFVGDRRTPLTGDAIAALLSCDG